MGCQHGNAIAECPSRRCRGMEPENSDDVKYDLDEACNRVDVLTRERDELLRKLSLATNFAFGPSIEAIKMHNGNWGVRQKAFIVMKDVTQEEALVEAQRLFDEK